MANTLNPKTIATNIATLPVSVTINGTPTTLTIKDLTGVAQAINSRDCPIMIPKTPFMDGIEAEPQAFGAATVRPWNVTYYLNYRILYAPVGTQRNIAEVLQPMTDLSGLVVTAILTGDITMGAEDSMAFTIENMGVVNAPNDDPFYGFDMRVQVMEYLN